MQGLDRLRPPGRRHHRDLVLEVDRDGFQVGAVDQDLERAATGRAAVEMLPHLKGAPAPVVVPMVVEMTRLSMIEDIAQLALQAS